MNKGLYQYFQEGHFPPEGSRGLEPRGSVLREFLSIGS